MTHDTQDTPDTITDQEVDRKTLESLLAQAAGKPLSFQDCDFQGADFSRLDLRGARFTACAIATTSFQGATLADTTWVRCRGGQANFASVDASDAVFHGGSLRNANLKLVRFEGADLREADLGGIDLTAAARLAGATISKTQAATLLAELRINVV